MPDVLRDHSGTTTLKNWLSASEIAALDLPGLPTAKYAVTRYAKAQGWDSRAGLARPRVGKGGGIEYHLDLLPPQARSVYVARHVAAIDVPASVARDAALEDKAAVLTGNASEARDARLALLAQTDRYAEAAALTRKRADRHFCDLYNAGKLTVAGWIKQQVRSLTPRTLARWRAEVRIGNASGLAFDRAAARRGTGLLDRANDGEVKTYLLAMIAKQPQLTAHHLRALAADRFADGITVGARRLPLPPIRTFQRALKIWRDEFRNELSAIRDPDGFKSKVRFSARVANPATRLNEVWQIDASPADMLCVDGRNSIYACIDIYSRRGIVLVSKTPRASAVGLLLRKAIIAWGVPERIKTDNGSDFVAHTTKQLIAALGIEHELSAPFSPEQKGHVERFIGTYQRGLVRTLEGYVGHSVADRKVIEGRKSFARRLGETAEDMFEVTLTAAELQARSDEWCSVNYGHAAHAGLKGLSPFAAAAGFAGTVRRIEDLRALDMLLAPIAGKDGVRTVTKTGLRIEGAHYIAGFLNVGDTVHVRMDPADMGRAYVYSANALMFLGEAIAPELLGIDPAEAIARARAQQKQLIDGRMADAKREARTIKAKDMAPAIHRQAQVAAGTLVEFPRAAQAHDTPQLAAARASIRNDDAAPIHAPDIAAIAAAMRAESKPTNVQPLRTQETPQQRWKRALALEATLAEGGEVSSDDLLWLGGYREGPEYRGLALTYGSNASTTKSPVTATGQA
ncbi:MAG: DDE-type integrase/transposase/recombinase [Rhodopseudomonas sp.]|nr:DDE-type integrase/transposase/recombinase [Rhodopseudomonas sp.]